MMARFLSDEWFGLVASTLALPSDRSPRPDGAAESHDAAVADKTETVAIRHRVLGAPDGDVDYVVLVGGVQESVVPRSDGPADIEIVADYKTAAAISLGELTPAAAFAAGRLKLSGDVALLANHQRALAALGDRLGPVRAETTY